MHHWPLALILPALLAGLGCGKQHTAAPSPTIHTASISAGATPVAPATDAARFQHFVEHLSSQEMGGRLPGSVGGDMARRWLVERFEAAGLAPAFGDSYTQPFRVALGVEVERQSISFAGKPLGRDDRAKALGNSANGSFDGDAVFVGYAVNNKDKQYDSFANADPATIKGKVFIVYRYEPMDDAGQSRFTQGRNWSSHAHLASKVKLAQSQGAAAVIIANPPARKDAVLHSAPSSTSGAQGRVPVMMIDYEAFKTLLRRAGHDDPQGFAGELQAAANAGPVIKPLGIKIAGEVRLTARTNTAHNVVAVAPGAGPLTDEVIVIGAHYDHIGHGEYGSRTGEKAIHPGADDNASGTAGLVLLAERFGKRLASGRAPANRRTLLFLAFDAEERGLIGASYFTRNLEQAGLEKGRIRAMLNMDMIGRLRDNKLMVGGVDSASDWRDRVRRAAEAEGLSAVPSGNPHGPSDHQMFYRIGVPVLHAFTGIHGDYHTPADTADKINFAGGVKVVNLVDRLARELWVEPQTVAYLPPKRGEAPNTAPRAFLGISPQMMQADDEVGVGVDSVTPEGPAANGGLKPGDRIVGFNGKTVEGFNDLRGALSKAKPGEAVKIKVARGEATLELDVELGRR